MRHYGGHVLCGLLLLVVCLQYLPPVTTQGSPGQRPPSQPRGGSDPPSDPPGPSRGGAAPAGSQEEGRDRDESDEGGRGDPRGGDRTGEPGYQPGSPPGGDGDMGTIRRPPIGAAPGPVYGGRGNNRGNTPMGGPEGPNDGRRQGGMQSHGPGSQRMSPPPPPPPRDCDDRMRHPPRNMGHRPPPHRPMRRPMGRPMGGPMYYPMGGPMGGMYGSQWEYEMWRDYWDQQYYNDRQEGDDMEEYGNRRGYSSHGPPRHGNGARNDMRDCEEEEDGNSHKNGDDREQYGDHGSYNRGYDDDDGMDEDYGRDMDRDTDRHDSQMDDRDQRGGYYDERQLYGPMGRPMYGGWDEWGYRNSYFNMGFGPYSMMTPHVLCPCMGMSPMMPPYYLPPRRRHPSRPPRRHPPRKPCPPKSYKPMLCNVTSLDTGDMVINETCKDGYMCVKTNQTKCNNVTISICIHENCTNMARDEMKECMMRKAEEEARRRAGGSYQHNGGQHSSGHSVTAKSGHGGGSTSGEGMGSGDESGHGSEMGSGRGRDSDYEHGSGGERGSERDRGSVRNDDRMRHGENEGMEDEKSEDMKMKKLIAKYLNCLGSMERKASDHSNWGKSGPFG